jgi:hypothetical protein
MRRNPRSALSVLLAVILVSTSCAHPTKTESPSAAPEERLWPSNPVPSSVDDPDDGSIEVGTAFTTASDGVITAVHFYQGPNTTADSATLWTSNGMRIATATIPTGPSGWREIRFDKPVTVTADVTYVVSYHASHGNYPSDADTFALGKTVKSGWLVALGGVFTYGDGFPDQPSKGRNYYVDVVFQSSGPTLSAVDGGDHYYDAFKNSFPTSPDFFPLGVWYTSTSLPQEIDADRALGLNTYVMLSAESNVRLIRERGMFALPNEPSADSAGQFLTDEADMWAGPGDTAWSGKMPSDPEAKMGSTCIPEGANCGYTVMMKLRNEVPRAVLAYANYGKGVTFWQTRDEAARFVNEFQNLVSVDNYWFSDDNICRADEGGALKTNREAALSPSECHLAANYGITTRYVRSLVQPRAAMPVWNFVELGHPSTDGQSATITGPQMRAAVWSSIINGARGIVYFVHNFGGPCPSLNLLRDHCGDTIRADLSAVNQQIGRLAPVLNAPFLDGYARSDDPVDLAVKQYDGNNYVLVGATTNEPSDATIALSCGNADSAEVIDENRTVPITNRTFHDYFADGNAIHLYKINRTDSCGVA